MSGVRSHAAACERSVYSTRRHGANDHDAESLLCSEQILLLIEQQGQPVPPKAA